MGKSDPNVRCLTCYGTGEVVTEGGPSVCPDCLGQGGAPKGEILEWRLREIERAHVGQTHGCEADVRWLVVELRRHREALVQVLTRCQDVSDELPLARELQHVANETLGLYRLEAADGSG
jgi:hypothetical protein